MTEDLQRLAERETKFTPGPWQSQHDFDRDGEYTIVGNVDGEYIEGHLHHSYTTVAEVYDNDSHAEDRANAHLIAAAPDLYEAAADALAGWNYIRAAHGDLYGVGWDRVEQALSAALAKARGETPDTAASLRARIGGAGL